MASLVFYDPLDQRGRREPARNGSPLALITQQVQHLPSQESKRRLEKRRQAMRLVVQDLQLLAGRNDSNEQQLPMTSPLRS
jgi:hypothetical protein